MSVVKKTLEENYIFFIRELSRIDEEIKMLPRGSISAKKIGKTTYYYHQWREGQRVKSVSLGAEMPYELLQSISRRKLLEGQVKEISKEIDVGSFLKPLGFSIGFNPNGSNYFTNGIFKIEFLVPQVGRGTDNAVYIKPLKISATPLRYLKMLFDQQMEVEKELAASSILVVRSNRFKRNIYTPC